MARKPEYCTNKEGLEMARKPEYCTNKEGLEMARKPEYCTNSGMVNSSLAFEGNIRIWRCGEGEPTYFAEFERDGKRYEAVVTCHRVSR